MLSVKKNKCLFARTGILQAAIDVRSGFVSLEHTYRGLRVIDLSENIAGPLAGMILADLGADVIKIEPPGRGDATRLLPPLLGGTSTVFLTFNRNKRSAAIDIRTPAGREAVLRVAKDADVVVESFRPGVADRLGLDCIAEGVETSVQSRVLLQRGCTTAQGYFFSPPLAPQDVETMMADIAATDGPSEADGTTG